MARAKNHIYVEDLYMVSLELAHADAGPKLEFVLLLILNPGPCTALACRAWGMGWGRA